MPRSSARSYAFLSLAAAIATITLKLVAYWVTGSVGLLSDAIESLINLVAAVVAIWALTVSVRPPDEEHAFGHTKAEYFASAAEGFLIIVAALGIGATAWERLANPHVLGQVWVGLSISVVASVINGGTAIVLMRAGKRLRSVTLEADARHLLTDVWTTAGVLVGVSLVELTGWLALDPIVALAVAANIAWTGVKLLIESGHGVLDSSVPKADRNLIDAILADCANGRIQFHDIRTRLAGRHRFVSLHVLVPGDWSVQQGHQLCEEIEEKIVAALPETTVFTHLEPVDDPASHADRGLPHLTGIVHRTDTP